MRQPIYLKSFPIIDTNDFSFFDKIQYQKKLKTPHFYYDSLFDKEISGYRLKCFIGFVTAMMVLKNWNFYIELVKSNQVS